MQRIPSEKTYPAGMTTAFLNFHAFFVFTDVVKVKIEDKFMTRERIAK